MAGGNLHTEKVDESTPPPQMKEKEKEVDGLKNILLAQANEVNTIQYNTIQKIFFRLMNLLQREELKNSNLQAIKLI